MEWNIMENMGVDMNEPSLIDYMDLSPVSPSRRGKASDESEAFVLALAVNERNIHLQREVEQLKKELELAKSAKLPMPPAAVSHWSPLEGRLLSCDEKFATLCQRERGELIGFSCRQLICSPDLDACHRVVQLLVDGTITSATIQQQWNLPSGEQTDVTSVITLNSSPGEAPVVRMETSPVESPVGPPPPPQHPQLSCGRADRFAEDPIAEILRLAHNDA